MAAPGSIPSAAAPVLAAASVTPARAADAPFGDNIGGGSASGGDCGNSDNSGNRCGGAQSPRPPPPFTAVAPGKFTEGGAATRESALNRLEYIRQAKAEARARAGLPSGGLAPAGGEEGHDEVDASVPSAPSCAAQGKELPAPDPFGDQPPLFTTPAPPQQQQYHEPPAEPNPFFDYESVVSPAAAQYRDEGGYHGGDGDYGDDNDGDIVFIEPPSAAAAAAALRLGLSRDPRTGGPIGAGVSSGGANARQGSGRPSWQRDDPDYSNLPPPQWHGQQTPRHQQHQQHQQHQHQPSHPPQQSQQMAAAVASGGGLRGWAARNIRGHHLGREAPSGSEGQQDRHRGHAVAASEDFSNASPTLPLLQRPLPALVEGLGGVEVLGSSAGEWSDGTELKMVAEDAPHFLVSVLQGRNLVSPTATGRMLARFTPYVTVCVGGVEKRTPSVAAPSGAAVWDQHLVFPASQHRPVTLILTLVAERAGPLGVGDRPMARLEVKLPAVRRRGAAPPPLGSPEGDAELDAPLCHAEWLTLDACGGSDPSLSAHSMAELSVTVVPTCMRRLPSALAAARAETWPAAATAPGGVPISTGASGGGGSTSGDGARFGSDAAAHVASLERLLADALAAELLPLPQAVEAVQLDGPAPGDGPGAPIPAVVGSKHGSSFDRNHTASTTSSVPEEEHKLEEGKEPPLGSPVALPEELLASARAALALELQACRASAFSDYDAREASAAAAAASRRAAAEAEARAARAKGAGVTVDFLSFGLDLGGGEEEVAPKSGGASSGDGASPSSGPLQLLAADAEGFTEALLRGASKAELGRYRDALVAGLARHVGSAASARAGAEAGRAQAAEAREEALREELERVQAEAREAKERAASTAVALEAVLHAAHGGSGGVDGGGCGVSHRDAGDSSKGAQGMVAASDAGNGDLWSLTVVLPAQAGGSGAVVSSGRSDSGGGRSGGGGGGSGGGGARVVVRVRSREAVLEVMARAQLEANALTAAEVTAGAEATQARQAQGSGARVVLTGLATTGAGEAASRLDLSSRVRAATFPGATLFATGVPFSSSATSSPPVRSPSPVPPGGGGGSGGVGDVGASLVALSAALASRDALALEVRRLSREGRAWRAAQVRWDGRCRGLVERAEGSEAAERDCRAALASARTQITALERDMTAHADYARASEKRRLRAEADAGEWQAEAERLRGALAAMEHGHAVDQAAMAELVQALSDQAGQDISLEGQRRAPVRRARDHGHQDRNSDRAGGPGGGQAERWHATYPDGDVVEVAGLGADGNDGAAAAQAAINAKLAAARAAEQEAAELAAAVAEEEAAAAEAGRKRLSALQRRVARENPDLHQCGARMGPSSNPPPPDLA